MAKARRPNWASMAIIMVIVVFFAASVESASTASPVDAGNAWAQQELAGEAVFHAGGSPVVRLSDVDRKGYRVIGPDAFARIEALR